MTKEVDRSHSGHWHDDGWTLIPRFLEPAEVELLRQEADRLLADPALFERRGEIPNSARRSDRLDPVGDLSSTFADLARSPDLLALAGDLLGGNAQLLKDKFIAKPPGAVGYAAHQDGAYWPGMGLDPSRFLTAIIFLDDATEANGAIECVSGCKQLLTDADTVADPDEASLGDFTTITAAAGDLLMLHALTPHRSDRNRSDSMRRALLFTYGVDDRPDLYAIYQQYRASSAS